MSLKTGRLSEVCQEGMRTAPSRRVIMAKSRRTWNNQVMAIEDHYRNHIWNAPQAS